MGQKLSLASITRNFLPCQVASRAIFSNGVTGACFQVLKGRLTNEIDFSTHTIKRTLSLNPGP